MVPEVQITFPKPKLFKYNIDPRKLQRRGGGITQMHVLDATLKAVGYSRHLSGALRHNMEDRETTQQAAGKKKPSSRYISG